jgi:hypothetical protein
VLLDSNLSPTRKRDILRRWALDAYQIETEHSKATCWRGFPISRR